MPAPGLGRLSASLAQGFPLRLLIPLRTDLADDQATSLAERLPNAAELMGEAREDVLAFRHFPKPH